MQRRKSTPMVRFGIGFLGLVGMAGGIVLLIHASSVNESRIARVAGILIVLGLAAIAAAASGWV